MKDKEMTLESLELINKLNKRTELIGELSCLLNKMKTIKPQNEYNFGSCVDLCSQMFNRSLEILDKLLVIEPPLEEFNYVGTLILCRATYKRSVIRMCKNGFKYMFVEALDSLKTCEDIEEMDNYPITHEVLDKLLEHPCVLNFYEDEDSEKEKYIIELQNSSEICVYIIDKQPLFS